LQESALLALVFVLTLGGEREGRNTFACVRLCCRACLAIPNLGNCM